MTEIMVFVMSSWLRAVSSRRETCGERCQVKKEGGGEGTMSSELSSFERERLSLARMAL
jgi:hypothetical protein